MKVGLKTEVHTRVKYIKISYFERMTTPLVPCCAIRNDFRIKTVRRLYFLLLVGEPMSCLRF